MILYNNITQHWCYLRITHPYSKINQLFEEAQKSCVVNQHLKEDLI